MEIHPQLVEDCHEMCKLPSGMLLLHRNAVLPWFILVPETTQEDALDLLPSSLSTVMSDCQAVSRFIKEELGYTKVNFAGLGNVVPQMHLHIIGRKPGDACWPRPVWGNLETSAQYDEATLAAWRLQLSNRDTHD